MKLLLANHSNDKFWSFPQNIIEELEKLSIEVINCTTLKELRNEIPHAAYIIGHIFPKNFTKNASNLKEIFFLASGYPDAFNGLDIPIHNLTGVNSRSVAEHALYLLLKASRGDLPKQKNLPLTLCSSRTGIIGHGAIGKQIYQLLRPIGDVSVLTRQSSESSHFYNYERSSEFLKAQDNIIITTAFNSETESFFSKDKFYSQLKTGANIINVARGQLIKEHEIIKFLEDNPSSVYVSDVAHPEPYPEDGVLNDHPRIYLTPHLGGTYAGVWEDITIKIKELVKQWIS